MNKEVKIPLIEGAKTTIEVVNGELIVTTVEPTESFPKLIQYNSSNQIVLALKERGNGYLGVSLTGVNKIYKAGNIECTFVTTKGEYTTLPSDTKVTLTVEQLLDYSKSLIDNAEKLK